MEFKIDNKSEKDKNNNQLSDTESLNIAKELDLGDNEIVPHAASLEEMEDKVTGTIVQVDKTVVKPHDIPPFNGTTLIINNNYSGETTLGIYVKLSDIVEILVTRNVSNLRLVYEYNDDAIDNLLLRNDYSIIVFPHILISSEQSIINTLLNSILDRELCVPVESINELLVFDNIHTTTKINESISAEDTLEGEADVNIGLL